MLRYISKRILHGVFVMWLVATVLFIGLRMLPGGPARTMLGKEATPEALHRLQRELGLLRPLPVQYADWMTDLLFLDLGQSVTSSIPVSTIIAQAAPKTFSIGLVGIVVGITLGGVTGVISATRKDRPIDYLATMAAFFGLSMPAFFIGIMLALVFGVWFNLLPVFGYTPIAEGPFLWLRSILLPGIAVGLPYGAIIMRITRSSLLEVMDEPYMETALAKGLNNNTRLYKHALQNALIPVVTLAGIQVAIILTGAVTVELVFGFTGLGRILVNSILTRNYPVTQGAILLIAAIMIFLNLAVDILYTIIDPRIRYGAESA